MAKFYIDLKTLRVVARGSFSFYPEEALEESIAKWQSIVDTYNAGTDKPVYCGGTRTCAFCQLYYEYLCVGCPVYLFTLLNGCQGTPYALYDQFYTDGDVENAAEAAKQEVEFLKSLRQKKKRSDYSAAPKVAVDGGTAPPSTDGELEST